MFGLFKKSPEKQRRQALRHMMNAASELEEYVIAHKWDNNNLPLEYDISGVVEMLAFCLLTGNFTASIPNILRDLITAIEKEQVAKWLCGECREVRFGDERVKNGMKCRFCASYEE